jgi:pimeloyl-ACP methyl ester carboxylesterase
MVAQQIALDHPDLVRKLILVGTVQDAFRVLVGLLRDPSDQLVQSGKQKLQDG